MAEPPRDEVQPDPMPVPDPDPPQPIPPPDPVPVPEPPHAAEDPQLVAQQADPATAPILEAGEPTITFPPIGAYPGEPGHPDQPGEGRPDQPGTSRPDQPGNQPGQPVPPGQPDERTQQWQHPLYPGQQWQAGEHGPWHPAPPPGSGQPWPLAEHPPYEVPLTPGTPAARPRRTALWVSLALAFTLLLCGGGAVSAFLLLRNADNGDGAPDPGTAVTRFLTAVYTEQNASEANAMVCREARDIKKITAKVDEVKGYAQQYDTPRFRWDDPAVAGQSEKSATVAVALTMTTEDEKTAQQRLTFTVVKKTGWWVCEVAG